MSRAGHGAVMSRPFNEDMKRRIAIIVVAILAITASMAAYYRGNGNTDAPKYITAAAVRGDVVESVEATGTLGDAVGGTLVNTATVSAAELRRALLRQGFGG